MAKTVSLCGITPAKSINLLVLSDNENLDSFPKFVNTLVSWVSKHSLGSDVLAKGFLQLLYDLTDPISWPV